MPSSSAPAETSVPIGTLIMAEIVRQRLTMDAVAREAHMPASQLSKIVTGQVDPKWTTLQRIAGALNISPAELFGQEVQEATPTT